MPLIPLELLAAAPWQRVTCTTYALSLSFFEAVALDSLVRGGASEAVVLSDVAGIRASLGELGAQRVGKDYQVEPIVISHGVFHPKITVLWSPQECHVIVGSGNLTFGGWGGNCEVLEHLHPSFAATAILDIADFFEQLATSHRARHAMASHCSTVAADLRSACQGHPANPDIRLFHSIGDSIADQLVVLAKEPGGATHLIAAAPYWDDGSAIGDLCRNLGLERVHVHAHRSGCVAGLGTSNWPRRATVDVSPVLVEALDDLEERRLHAKAFEVLCNRGRIVMSGSANASMAALGAGMNIEACVVRIQRAPSRGWSFSPTAVPAPEPPRAEDDGEESQSVGVLRAVLEGDDVTGSVITPRMTGTATVSLLGTAGADLLGEATLGEDGHFHLRAPGLEERSYKRGRIVIRVTDSGGRRAEGFVGVSGFSTITRRLGIAGRHIFAVIGGSAVPEDVDAMLAFLREDLNRFAELRAATGGHGNGDAEREPSVELIPVGALGIAPLPLAKAEDHGNVGDRRWRRFVDQLLAAIRGSRGRIKPDDGDDGDDESENAAGREADEGEVPTPESPARFSNFEAVLAACVDSGANARDVLFGLDFTQYMCESFPPEAKDAKRWLQQLLAATERVTVPTERRAEVAACVLVLAGASPTPEEFRIARARLLHLGVDLAASAPPEDGAHGFAGILPRERPWAELWTGVSECLTSREQRRAYLDAMKGGLPSGGYPDLPTGSPREWPALRRAVITDAGKRHVMLVEEGATSCPKCNVALPPSELAKLRSSGIATALGCCERVMIVEDNRA